MELSTYMAILLPSLTLLVSIIALWVKGIEQKKNVFLNTILLIIFLIGVLIVIFVSKNYFVKEDMSNSDQTSSMVQSPDSISTSLSAPENEESGIIGSLDPITYNDGTAIHVLSGDIIHFPCIENGDFTVGGIWSLQPDFTKADPYVLVISKGYSVVKRAGENDAVCYGKVEFGTVWSEDDFGNWSEKQENFISPFSNSKRQNWWRLERAGGECRIVS